MKQILLWEDLNCDEGAQVELLKERLPIGSRIRVYVVRVLNTGDMKLVIARSPSLQYPHNLPFEGKKKSCPFQFLVILDFEATTDYSPEPCKELHLFTHFNIYNSSHNRNL